MYRWFLILIAIWLPMSASAQTEFNAGFVEGLWFSTDDLLVGETIRIYAAIRNNTGDDMTGTVSFYDNEKLIAESDISALDGRVIESWADWKPAFGDHELTAELDSIKLHSIGESPIRAKVEISLAADTIFIDEDTDNDKIGNQIDEDDDGDTIPDKDDAEPLIFNKPKVDPTVITDPDSLASSTALQPLDNSDRSQQGLEQYLEDSRFDSWLGGVTNQTNELKDRLDNYRQERNQPKDTTEESEQAEYQLDTSSSTFTDGSFGEITRNQADQDNEGFVASVFGLIGAIFSSIYSVILLFISLLLGHPVVVQISILIFILLLIYKITKRLARRPQ